MQTINKSLNTISANPTLGFAFTFLWVGVDSIQKLKRTLTGVFFLFTLRNDIP